MMGWSIVRSNVYLFFVFVFFFKLIGMCNLENHSHYPIHNRLFADYFAINDLCNSGFKYELQYHSKWQTNWVLFVWLRLGINVSNDKQINVSFIQWWWGKYEVCLDWWISKCMISNFFTFLDEQRSSELRIHSTWS